MRILIAEQSPILRKRLTRLFSELEFVSLVAFVEELSQVKQISLKENPDVIVVDIDFPSRANIKMLNALENKAAQTRILLLTETIEPRYIRQFKNSGVDMIFNKKDELNEFISHLNKIEGSLKSQVK
jgi:DNA-binding NarL/FixJ family response regulator